MAVSSEITQTLSRIPESFLQCPVCENRYSTSSVSSRRPVLLTCHHSVCKKCLSKLVMTYADAFPEESSKVVCPECNTTTTLSPDGSLQENFYVMSLIENIVPEDEDCGMRNLLMWCETCEDVAVESCEEHEVTKFPEAIEKTEGEINKIIEESFKNLNFIEKSFDHVDEATIEMNISTLQESFDKVKCMVDNRIDFMKSSLDVKSGTTEKIDKINEELINLKAKLQENTTEIAENSNCSKRISCGFCTDGKDLLLVKQRKLTDILCYLKKLNSPEYNHWWNNTSERLLPSETPVSDPLSFQMAASDLSHKFHSCNLNSKMFFNKCCIKKPM